MWMIERVRGRKGEWENGRKGRRKARLCCFIPLPPFLPLPLSPSHPPTLSPFLPLTLSLLLVLAACDDSFNPVSESKTDFFAVSGFLDTAADTHFVRVNPVRETLTGPQEPRAIAVTTTHLTTGTQTAWQDSLVLLDNGRPGHLFFAQIPVEPGEAYRLEVRGAGGEMTQAVTRVPPRIRLAPGPLVPGFNQRLTQRVTLIDQMQVPSQANLIYEITPPGAGEPITMTSFFIGAGPGPDGVQFVINLEFHREEILTRLGLPRIDSTVVLNSIGLEIEHLSAEWGIEDSPTIPGPIENGFGFFGSVARYTTRWTLDPAGLQRLGFRPPG